MGENLLVSGGFDCKLTLTDLIGNVISDLSMNDVFGNTGVNPPHIYCICKNEDEIAVGLGNGSICIFEVEGKLIGKKNWEAHNERVMCCSYSKGNNMLATACNSDLALWRESLVKRIKLENKVKSK